MIKLIKKSSKIISNYGMVQHLKKVGKIKLIYYLKDFKRQEKVIYHDVKNK